MEGSEEIRGEGRGEWGEVRVLNYSTTLLFYYSTKN